MPRRGLLLPTLFFAGATLLGGCERETPDAAAPAAEPAETRTAWVDADGRPQFRSDVYQRDASIAAALDEARRLKDVDFPSYEIISSPPFGGQFYAENKRSVEQDGVNHVMANFFACMGAAFPGSVREPKAGAEEREDRQRKRKAEQDRHAVGKAKDQRFHQTPRRARTAG